ncbi:hypothetical protein [Streptomyces goshikiensis]|uniref:hypothetical protein n=1 Tax=Streptomyces goshikiensis TaxID=1942 RepID=UPI003680D678
MELPDGTIKLPEGTATLPPGTVKLPFDDSPAKYADEAGNLYKEDGSLFQRGDRARTEETPVITNPATKPTADVPLHTTPAKVEVPDRVLVGVGGRGDDITRVSSDISDPLDTVDNGAHGTGGFDHTPTNRAGDHGTPGGHAGDNLPRNDLNNTPTAAPTRTPRPRPPLTRTAPARAPPTRPARAAAHTLAAPVRAAVPSRILRARVVATPEHRPRPLLTRQPAPPTARSTRLPVTSRPRSGPPRR